MAYRNKTYVAFDADKDMWAYAYMKGWSQAEHIDFNFQNAHDIKELTSRAQDEYYIKRVLRERLESSKQFILLIGESTKYLRKYVQWEIEYAIGLDIPIIAVNLNKEAGYVASRCPSALKNHMAVHGAFSKNYIKTAMNDFTPNYRRYQQRYTGPIWYNGF